MLVELALVKNFLCCKNNCRCITLGRKRVATLKKKKDPRKISNFLEQTN